MTFISSRRFSSLSTNGSGAYGTGCLFVVVVFVHWWSTESFFVSLMVAFAAVVCFEWTFPCQMPASTSASGWRFLLWCTRCSWVLLSLNGVDSGSYFKYCQLYHMNHASDSPAIDLPLQLAVESCQDFVLSLCDHPIPCWPQLINKNQVFELFVCDGQNFKLLTYLIFIFFKLFTYK